LVPRATQERPKQLLTYKRSDWKVRFPCRPLQKRGLGAPSICLKLLCSRIFLYNFQTMFWRPCFWPQGPTQECSKDSQGQSQDGPSGPKMRVCACRSAHQWIGRTHIRAHRPETDLPKTTQEPKGPPRTAPKSLQGSPRTTRTISRTTRTTSRISNFAGHFGASKVSSTRDHQNHPQDHQNHLQDHQNHFQDPPFCWTLWSIKSVQQNCQSRHQTLRSLQGGRRHRAQALKIRRPQGLSLRARL